MTLSTVSHAPMTELEPASGPTALLIRPLPLPPGVRGFAPASDYVETFWLGILGPSATWLLRRLGAGLESYPEGFELDLVETATSLGLAFRPGRPGPFTRALERCVMFGLAEHGTEVDRPVLWARHPIPALPSRRVERLPSFLRAAHASWDS